MDRDRRKENTPTPNEVEAKPTKVTDAHNRPFENVDCTSSDELLEALSPLGPNVGDDPVSPKWIFRGQGDARFRLVPSAFRTILERGWDGNWYLKQGPAAGMMIQREAKWLFDFVELADRHGLAVPHGSTAVLQYLRDFVTNDWRKIDAANWPNAIIHPSLALAQHHRVRTRLLDWSYSSHVAAFFAARDCAVAHELAQGPPTERERLAIDPPRRAVSHLAVWALSPPELPAVPRETQSVPYYYQLLRVPTADNANLRAQRGAFLLYRLDHNRELVPLPFEDVLHTFAPEARLIRFTLPAALAGDLLRSLAIVGITSAALFPGYDGVKAAIDERAYWPKT